MIDMFRVISELYMSIYPFLKIIHTNPNWQIIECTDIAHRFYFQADLSYMLAESHTCFMAGENLHLPHAATIIYLMNLAQLGVPFINKIMGIIRGQTTCDMMRC